LNKYQVSTLLEKQVRNNARHVLVRQVNKSISDVQTARYLSSLSEILRFGSCSDFVNKLRAGNHCVCIVVAEVAEALMTPLFVLKCPKDLTQVVCFCWFGRKPTEVYPDVTTRPVSAKKKCPQKKAGMMCENTRTTCPGRKEGRKEVRPASFRFRLVCGVDDFQPSQQ
jgi:hypothetical protein